MKTHNWYKIAKKIITPKEMGDLQAIITKIMKGHKEWTPQELQLQTNFPEEIESLLIKEYKKR